MTRVGVLVECGRAGLEVVVCRKICQLIAADHGLALAPEIVPMDNKARLIEECGTAARTLLASGCERVVILWDERPAWPEMHAELCWHHERIRILEQLQNARVPEGRAHLVCIEREFESWLLFDHRMLSAVLSTPAHRVHVSKQANPDRRPNPKGAMITLFNKLAGKRYVDVQFAARFAECLDGLNRLRKCRTFRRFEERITGIN